MQDRRDFLKTSCSLCMAAIGLGILVSEESCKSPFVFTTEADKEKMSVPLDLMGDRKTLLVKNPLLENEILLIRKTEHEYTALLMRCSHRGVALKLKTELLACPEHGSIFDLDGKVLKSPATKPLIKFPVEVRGDRVVILMKTT